MNAPLILATFYLLDTLFSIVILLILLRFLLQVVRADFYNPLSQFVVKMTNPIVVPLRRIIPGYAGIDLTSLLLAYTLCILHLVANATLIGAHMPSIFALLILGSAKLLSHLLSFYFYAILIIVFMSWVTQGAHNPIVSVLRQLTHPISAPVQKIIPPISGFDLSPVVVIMGIKLMEILVVGFIQQLASYL